MRSSSFYPDGDRSLSPSPSSVLSGQGPTDPDETFFILSLTEIPLCSLREMGDSTSEPLLPVAELSQQQQRLVHHSAHSWI